MKKPVIAMRLHRGFVNIDNSAPAIISLPEGCLGMFFCFESKKSAEACLGKDTQLLEVRLTEEKE